MKTKILITTIIVSSFVIRHSSFAQGALTPPGAPAPTMITLSQIEPRTPISSAPFTISQSGAYYLTTNLVSSFSDAIIIATNHVTLDLNGFTISSSYSGNAGSGIWLNGAYLNIAIFNGHIISGVTNNGSGVYSGPGFFNGIEFSGPTPQNVRVSGLTVLGTVYYGIHLDTGNSTLVENCQVCTVGSYGIIASTIKSSSAADIGGTAITGDQVVDCRGQSTVNGHGIVAHETVQNSYGYTTNNYDDGIYCGGTAQNCYGYSYGSGSATGVYAQGTAINCAGYNVGNGYGVSAVVIDNCYGYNIGSGYGLTGTQAHNCWGTSTNGIAISTTVAQGCFGQVNGGSNPAISGVTAENCFGYHYGSGYGIDLGISGIALNCSGYSAYGTGLHALIANSCHAATFSGTAFNVTHSVNSF